MSAEIALTHLFYRAPLRERFRHDVAGFVGRGREIFELSERDASVLGAIDVPGMLMEAERRLTSLEKELAIALPLSVRAIRLTGGSGTWRALVEAFAASPALDHGTLRSVAGRFAQFVAQRGGAAEPFRRFAGQVLELEFNARLLMAKCAREPVRAQPAPGAAGPASRPRRSRYAVAARIDSNADAVLNGVARSLDAAEPGSVAAIASGREFALVRLSPDEATIFELATGANSLSSIAWYLDDPLSVLEAAGRLARCGAIALPPSKPPS